jgi:hypothetical protein
MNTLDYYHSQIPKKRELHIIKKTAYTFGTLIVGALLGVGIYKTISKFYKKD